MASTKVCHSNADLVLPVTVSHRRTSEGEIPESQTEVEFPFFPLQLTSAIALVLGDYVSSS